jgi:hypothetical protein
MVGSHGQSHGSRLGPTGGSHCWLPRLGPKVGSQSVVPRVLRLGVKGRFEGWVADPWVTRLSPQAGFQGWVPRSQHPSPDEGLVLLQIL